MSTNKKITQNIFKTLGITLSLSGLFFSSLPAHALVTPPTCTIEQELVAGKCAPSQIDLSGYIYEDFNDNGMLDNDDKNHPIYAARVFTNQTRYCPPENCGYTFAQIVSSTDRSGKYTFKSNYSIESKINLFDSTRVSYEPAQQSIKVLPANQSAIRTESENTFAPILVRKTNTKRLPTVGDTAFYDRNGNGVQDDGDYGIPFVDVTLFDQYGQQIGDKVYTDMNGKYSFTTEPREGLYLKFHAPDDSGYIFTNQNVGFNDEKDSDVSDTGKSDSFTLKYTDKKTGMDAGFYRTVEAKATLRGSVFNDKNSNSTFEWNKDWYVWGAKAVLSDKNGKVIASTFTNYYGEYRFSELNTMEDYTVEVTVPSGYQLSTSTNKVTKKLKVNDNRMSDIGMKYSR
jgi:hypothetical protein